MSNQSWRDRSNNQSNSNSVRRENKPNHKNTNSDLVVNTRWKKEEANSNTKNNDNRNHDNRNRDNRNRDNRNRDNRNRYNRNNNYYNYSGNLPPPQPKAPENNTINFPSLQGNKVSVDEPQTNNYIEMCKKKKTEDLEKESINVKDPQYWDRKRWIGPHFMKANKLSDKWSKYIETASKNASTIIIPHNTIYHSRDSINWFPSWKETFTQQEWDDMNKQEDLDIANTVMQKLSEKYEKDLDEAYDLYYETGEVNITLQVHLESCEYEKWLEEFEKQFEEDDNEEQFNEDEEYLSDYSK